MATLHVLCGLPGTGKSTFAQRLERDTSALRLANDDWMRALFGRNPPEAEFRAAFTRIETLQWQLATEVLARGIDVIWDYGVWTRADRATLHQRATATGAAFVLYEIACDIETAVQRVLARSQTDDRHLQINREALEQFHRRFEPPTADEGFPITRIAGAPPP